ncbi:hypothetical protein GF386_00905 [Candidatus Pacearchaeota archaeon]|nr:hypothetical protein [Candidatus Pacearchaeota archaeon]
MAHYTFAAITIPKEVNPNGVDMAQYFLNWFMWTKRIQMTCKNCGYVHQGQAEYTRTGKIGIKEFPKLCPKCNKKPNWKGRYQDKLGHNLIPREVRFFEFAVPEEKEDVFLQDMRTWIGEFYDCDRYGQRKTTIQKMLNKAYKFGKPLLGKARNVITPIDMKSYPMKKYNKKEKDAILKDGVFSNVYAGFKIIDGYVPDSKTKREII